MNPQVLAVIPARGGSQGIARKNLVPLRGKPLLAYTIEAARAARRVQRVVVSTDDHEIRAVAMAWGAEAPFLRPPELARDNVHAVRVVLHALDHLERHEGYRPDIVVMLLPTSPLRQARQIDEAITAYVERRAPAVISAFESEKRLPHLRRLRNGCLEPVVPLATPNVQRQECEPLYAVNGAIFVASPETLREAGTFHVPGAIPYLMPRETSVDVNDADDLRYAEYVLNAGAP